MKQHPTIRECLGTPLLPAHVMTPLDTCMYEGITHVSAIPSHLQKLEVTERLEALVNHSFKRLSTVALQYPPIPSPASLGRTPWIRKP